MPELVIHPVYPCKVCKVSRPMHYTPELSHGTMPDGLDLVTCWVCKTTQVRDRFEQLILGAAIRKAWAALVDDIAYPVDNPVDNSLRHADNDHLIRRCWACGDYAYADSACMSCLAHAEPYRLKVVQYYQPVDNL